jgi:hypothetical protein
MQVIDTIHIWWWRQKKQKAKQRIHQPNVALTARDGQGNHDPNNCIPGVVELDQASLADTTTLGEQTAGRHRPKKKKSPQQAIQQPIDSFDENSLYTTPFPLQLLDEASSSYYLAMPSTPSAFSSQIVEPFDYDGNILLFPLSDTNNESSDGIYSAGGQASGPISVDEGPIDLDTEEPYERMEEGRLGPIDSDTDDFYQGGGMESHLLENDESRAQKVSQAAIEHGDLDLNPYEMDEWSCDFEDFDRGS